MGGGCPCVKTLVIINWWVNWLIDSSLNIFVGHLCPKHKDRLLHVIRLGQSLPLSTSGLTERHSLNNNVFLNEYIIMNWDKFYEGKEHHFSTEYLQKTDFPEKRRLAILVSDK